MIECLIVSKSKAVAGRQRGELGIHRLGREAKSYFEALLTAFLVVTFLFTTVGVVGASMLPTLDGGRGRLPSALLEGDRVFIPKYETWLRRLGILGPYRPGTIVVVR